jgi:flagellar biosynthesis/type III secretory pathway protein FliH
MLDEKFSASPVYQWTIEKGIAIGKAEGRAEGIAIGKAEGRAEGRAEGIAIGKAESNAEILLRMRPSVIEIIFDRFSSLTRFAIEVLATIDDPVLLYTLAIKLAQAQSTEDAQHILLKAQAAVEGSRASSSMM